MRIGISGHQDLIDDEIRQWVSDALGIELRRIVSFTGVSCLAAGSDQLFASLVVDLQQPLESVIPCRNYQNTFSNPDDLKNYRDLLSLSQKIHYLDADVPSEVAYLNAGKFLVDHSDWLFFVWNGKPAKGIGGTADIVDYARSRGIQYTLFLLEELRVINVSDD